MKTKEAILKFIVFILKVCVFFTIVSIDLNHSEGVFKYIGYIGLGCVAYIAIRQIDKDFTTK